MRQHDDTNPQGDGHGPARLREAMTALVEAAHDALDQDARGEMPALRTAVARVAAEARAAGLHADRLRAALDEALTPLAQRVAQGDGEHLRAAVAALALRAHVAEAPDE